MPLKSPRQNMHYRAERSMFNRYFDLFISIFNHKQMQPYLQRTVRNGKKYNFCCFCIPYIIITQKNNGLQWAEFTENRKFHTPNYVITCFQRVMNTNKLYLKIFLSCHGSNFISKKPSYDKIQGLR